MQKTNSRLEDVEQYSWMFPSFSSVNICIICLEVEVYFIKIGLFTKYIIKECKDKDLTESDQPGEMLKQIF